MEDLVRGRRPLRGQLKRLANDTSVILKKESPSQEDIKVLRTNYDLLESTINSILEWDDKIKAKLYEERVNEEDEDEEYRGMEETRRIYLNARGDIDDFYSRSVEKTKSESVSSMDSYSHDKKKKYHLPEVKLKSFSGKLKDWLGWWSQFRQINEDEELRSTDKFHYLVQAMEKGSEARELVESYPMTGENYVIAVEALTERFGRPDLLLQVYIRELLTLVISNVSSNQRLPLPQLYIRLESHLRSLAELNLDKADPATWLFPLVESSLSEETLRAWQRSSLSRSDGEELENKKTRLDLLMEFIKSEVRSEQQITLAQQGFQEMSNSGKFKPSKNRLPKSKSVEEIPTAAGLFAEHAELCGFCDKPHNAGNCFKARNLAMEERREIIRKKGLCFQCLRSGHIRKHCRSKVKCGKCGGGHYELVCRQQNSSLKRGSQNETRSSVKRVKFVGDPADGDLQIVTQHSNQCYNKVLLNTLKVKVQDKTGNVYTLRLVGDSASQRSFGSTKTFKQAESRTIGNEWLQTVLFGGEVTIPKCYAKKKITIIGFNGKEMSFELLEKQQITGNIQEIPNGPWIQEAEASGIHLNDIGDEASEADILIGNDYWGAIRTGRMVHLSCGLVAEETIFGWTLGGALNTTIVSMTAATVRTVPSQEIEKLWSLELIGIRDPAETKTLKEEEESALDHFKQTVSRDQDGRFEVALPWKMTSGVLPSNRKIAVQRLRGITDKLEKSGQLKLYHEVFRNWESESLITRVIEDDDSGHFIPHRPVFKESPTTPVRPVFDASCRSGRNPSLNDCLYKGPNLIEHIPTMLLRFGEKEIGVTADIRKAFQMIGVRGDDRKFQRFLWWEDESCKKMVTYEHNRVVFGVTSSPFLLGAIIKFHLDNCADGEVVDILKKSFYVDNLLTSVSSDEDYIQLQSQANAIMEKAKMELRQWACSGTSITSQEEFEPILGLAWNRRDDTISCSIKKFIIDDVVTKRMMLSLVAQVFDPMGYLAPAMIVPKLMVQETWSHKCGWDEPVCVEVAKRFKSWSSQLEILGRVKIPRYNKVEGATAVEVHVLCDSSKHGMAAVAFLRSEGSNVKLQFLLCKSRLTPMKKITIPRAELVSCVIGVRIAKAINEALEIPLNQFIFWSDSSTALAWIKRTGDWGVFVSNRVKSILDITYPDQWHHVPGKENPADLPSRGCSPRTLFDSKWWEGPLWLLESPVPYLNLQPDVSEKDVEAELKKTATIMLNFNHEIPKFSSYRRNIAVMGWMLRFVSNCRSSKKVKTDKLSIGELRLAEKKVLREIQRSSFPADCQEIGGIHVESDE